MVFVYIFLKKTIKRTNCCHILQYCEIKNNNDGDNFRRYFNSTRLLATCHINV